MRRLLPIRSEQPPDDTVVIIRAGVMSVETLRRTAADSFEDFGAYLISVEAVMDGLTVVETCTRSTRIGHRYGRVRLSTVGRLRSAGLVLLATFAARTSTWPYPTSPSSLLSASRDASTTRSTTPDEDDTAYRHEWRERHALRYLG